MADIFVSYKREDDEHAQTIVRALEAEGFSTWWDHRIAPADHWDEVIEREIGAARAVIVLWTPASIGSQWVRAEAQFGLNARKLAPVLLEACTPPLAFLMVQAIDLCRWDGDPNYPAWLKLRAYLSDVMKGAARQAAADVGGGGPGDEWRAAFGRHVSGEAIQHGSAVTAAAPTGTVFKDKAELPLMTVLAGGSFVMGSRRGEADARENEHPQRRVDVAKFALGVYAVTAEQWEAARLAGGVVRSARDFGWGGGAMPVVDVSWDDAHAYLAWLSRTTGERYRLPSEAEWEYACRAGGAGAFAFDGPAKPTLARYGADRPLPVGSMPPNRFGLCEMHGNVREWVEDLWHDSYGEAPIDAIPWTTGHSGMRVVRGGAFSDEAWFLRSASRGRAAASDRCNFIGFRVARDLS